MDGLSDNVLNLVTISDNTKSVGSYKITLKDTLNMDSIVKIDIFAKMEKTKENKNKYFKILKYLFKY